MRERFSGSRRSRLRRLRYLLLQEERYPVTIAVGKHLFPSRTQQLSPPAPMVLPWQRGGRVGRCRVSLSCFQPFGSFRLGSRAGRSPGDVDDALKTQVQHVLMRTIGCHDEEVIAAEGWVSAVAGEGNPAPCGRVHRPEAVVGISG